MKKLLIACTAVMVASLAIATSSMAATYETATYSEDKTSVSLGVDISALDADQLTVIVVEAASDGTFPTTVTDSQILYIDQGAKGTITFQDMKVRANLEDGKTYYIAVGSDNIANGIIYDKVTVGEAEEEIIGGCGNVSLDYDRKGNLADPQKINASDVTALKKYTAGVLTEEEINYPAANTNIDYDRKGNLANPQKVNASDVTVLKKYTGGLPGYETLPFDSNAN